MIVPVVQAVIIRLAGEGNTMSAETSSLKVQATELVISEWINTTGFTLTDIRSKKVV